MAASPPAQAAAAPPQEEPARLGTPAATGARPLLLLAALCAVTFFQGNVSMGYQLVGSRLLYPYFGSTIHVWALLISTFLLSFSLGSFLGGAIAQTRAGRRRGSLLLALSLAGSLGFLVTAVLGRPLLDALEPVGSGLPPMLSLTLACAALFLVPVGAVSALSPILADLAARLGRTTGPAAGLVYGISTAGNIAGILLTVFVLIPRYPVSSILHLWLVAAVLLYALFHLLDARIGRAGPALKESRP